VGCRLLAALLLLLLAVALVLLAARHGAVSVFFPFF
jgi:hypothetical protein